jgi:hypothetical protein
MYIEIKIIFIKMKVDNFMSETPWLWTSVYSLDKNKLLRVCRDSVIVCACMSVHFCKSAVKKE